MEEYEYGIVASSVETAKAGDKKHDRQGQLQKASPNKAATKQHIILLQIKATPNLKVKTFILPTKSEQDGELSQYNFGIFRLLLPRRGENGL